LNEVGKSGNTYYTCKTSGWTKSTALEYDTYGWDAGTEGAVKPGSVNTSNHYVYENGAWRASASEIENNLGACVASRLNEVGKSGNTYYTCKTSGWTKSTALEYDTYGWEAGTEGEIKVGSVSANNYYIYKDSKWQETSIGTDLGICNSDKDGFVGVSGGVYYICKTNSWNIATVLEYDTYGWTVGTEGEVKAGNVNIGNYYIYKDSEWQAASSVEKNLGGCTTAREGEVDKSENTYYICKSKTWKTATVLEYDTYGKTCLTDGSIVPGEITSTNKYVCDAGAFRAANEQEISLNKGCVSYTEGNEIRKQLSSVTDSVYLCNNDLWEKNIEFAREYGTLTDERDGKTYKTVVIGSQTWMAENLNYSDSTNYPSMKGRNWCYENKLDSCSKYGRLYTWSAAMDSVGTFSTNGKGCGNGKTCSTTYPVRGICPEGWHLPSKTEYATLITTVGGSSTAGKMLKATNGWNSNGNGTDAFGFSVLPAGRYSGGSFFNAGEVARFWSMIGVYDSAHSYADILNLSDSGEDASLFTDRRKNAFSVRCLRD